jgi:hypothetical protein
LLRFQELEITDVSCAASPPTADYHGVDPIPTKELTREKDLTLARSIDCFGLCTCITDG